MATFGVTLVSPAGSIVESLDIEAKADFKQLNASDGTFSEARTYDHSFSVSVKGRGDTCPMTLGGSNNAPSEVTGKMIWTTTALDSKNDDFRGWSCSGTAYPHAT